MNPVLIGLTGKAQHGKDTFFAALVAEFGVERVRRAAFADGVRREAKECGAWDGLVPYTVAGRSALQKFGTDRRGEDPLYWVKAAFKFIRDNETARTHGDWAGNPIPEVFIWVITDVRFRNEADAIREAGGVVVRVQRYVAPDQPFDNGMSAEQRAHISEVDMDSYETDHTVDNLDGDRPAFERNAVYLAHCLLGAGEGRMRDEGADTTRPARAGRMNFEEPNDLRFLDLGGDK